MTHSIPFNTMPFFAVLMALLPLGSFLVLIFFGNRLGRRSDALAIAVALASLLLSLFICSQVWNQAPIRASGEWISLAGVPALSAGIVLDNLSVLMLGLVCFISLLVQIYSISYMHGDPHYSRYFAYLGLFTFSMLGLILADSLLLMYVFWELVGLSSYLLIGFWFERPAAVAASRKAFIINRIGDAGFLVGIMLLYAQFGTTELASLANAKISATSLMSMTGLCLFCGCIGKSAQFPLQTWLPDAMEGPTPVSALIHAATMVAAGIFLLARVFFLLVPDVLMIIAIIGAITTFMGAYAALSQHDIKKVLAFSTISQLGLMVMAMGVGAYEAALFHLLTHAFFKAGLFLCAGAIIHALHHAATTSHSLHYRSDSQDMRQMGGLRKQMPFTFVCYTLAAASLAGLPLFSGFLSKDAILLSALNWAIKQEQPILYAIPLLGFLSAGFTAFYMGRQWLLIFGGTWRGRTSVDANVHETSFAIKFPLALLAILSIGFIFSLNPFDAHASWFIKGIDQGHSIDLTSQNHALVAILSVILALVGLLIAWKRYGKAAMNAKPGNFLYRLSLENWFLNRVYHVLFVRPLLKLASFLQFIDQRIIDRFVNFLGAFNVVLAHIIAWTDRALLDGTVNGTVWLAGQTGRLTRSFQNGKIQTYFIFALLGLVLIAVWIIL